MNLFKWMLILIGVLASVSQSHGETYPRTWMTVTNEISRNENISTLGTADWKKETECVAVNDLFAEEEVLTGNSNDGTGLNVSSSHGRILSRLLERQNEGF
jgi:hypothetical protein